MNVEHTVSFLLPQGYRDEQGQLHRSGRMRRASAADEVRAMLDPRSREQEGYGIIVLLASVIVSLGDLAGVDTKVIEALSEEDLTYLREQYRILNEAGSSTLVQSFKKVKNFKSPLFIDDLKFFCCQVLKFYVACVVCVAPLLYNILEVFDHETLV